MKKLSGVGASPGTAIAPAYVYRPDVYDVPAGPVADPDKAVRELAVALDSVAADLDEAARAAAGAAADILRAQAEIARDPALRSAAEPEIRRGDHPAGAILAAGERFARELEATGNEYLAARAPDVRHICDVAARALANAPPRLPPRPTTPCILAADDLTPSEMTTIDPSLVRGIATVGGSRTSHTAVVARGLGIPAVVGLRGLLDELIHDHSVGLDGSAGVLFVEPDAPTVAALTAAGSAGLARRERLRAAAGTGPATTRDGRHIEVAANVRSVEELRKALDEGAEAVGLLRTELLYVDRDRPPGEEEQTALLREMHGLLGDRRLVVRTFDIGADKQVPFLPIRPEHNPELGVRGIRLAQVHPDLLDTQLRSVAATAALGPTAVMAPMIATVDEARWFVDRARAAGIPTEVELGVMVEVPSLVLTVEEVARHVAFLSIGTNDLGQYLHAADRRSPNLTALTDPFNPALLRAVDMICRGSAGRCWVGVCGEAASDPGWALLAIGLGVTELSMQAVAIPGVRAAIRGVTFDECRSAAIRALRTTEPYEARAIAYEMIEEQP